MNINTIIFAGNITKDPELKALPSGVKVTSFSVASNETYKDKDGNKQQSTEYGNVVVYGAQAESCAKYLQKGSGVLVEGKIKTRSWEKDEVKHYRTEIVAKNVQFGARPTDSPKQPEQGSQGPNLAPEWKDKIEYPDDDINPEDVPF